MHKLLLWLQYEIRLCKCHLHWLGMMVPFCYLYIYKIGAGAFIQYCCFFKKKSLINSKAIPSSCFTIVFPYTFILRNKFPYWHAFSYIMKPLLKQCLISFHFLKYQHSLRVSLGCRSSILISRYLKRWHIHFRKKYNKTRYPSISTGVGLHLFLAWYIVFQGKKDEILMFALDPSLYPQRTTCWVLLWNKE